MKQLIYFLLLSFLAHFLVWIQLNLQFIDSRLKSYNTWLVLAGIPISWLWIKATEHGVASFDGKFWPQRLIAFSIGILLYTLLTHYFFGEKIDAKSMACISLAFAIVMIQIFWK
jgi:hypothetical protein